MADLKSKYYDDSNGNKKHEIELEGGNFLDDIGGMIGDFAKNTGIEFVLDSVGTELGISGLAELAPLILL